MHTTTPFGAMPTTLRKATVHDDGGLLGYELRDGDVLIATVHPTPRDTTTTGTAALLAAAPELRDALTAITTRNSKHSAGYVIVDADLIDAARALLERLR